MSNIHFSSKTDMWSTPQGFFDGVAKDYNFVLDVCATSKNTKCPTYYSIEEGCDGLKMQGNLRVTFG